MTGNVEHKNILISDIINKIHNMISEENTTGKTQQSSQIWSNFSQIYSKLDSTPQTFYYTLINMLKIQQSKHILEVGCGTARLLPLAINLKQKGTTYLATDLTPSMIQMAQKCLKKHLEKYEVKGSYEEWISKQNLSFRAANAELPIQSPYKFDRIIANLVVNLTQDPTIMMNNFYNIAEEGCLLGITVWGNKTDNNFFSLFPDLIHPFHLHGKLKQLGEKTGWQLVTNWQQNAPFVHLEPNEMLLKHIALEAEGNQKIIDRITEQVKEILTANKSLNFSCELAIFKKNTKS